MSSESKNAVSAFVEGAPPGEVCTYSFSSSLVEFLKSRSLEMLLQVNMIATRSMVLLLRKSRHQSPDYRRTQSPPVRWASFSEIQRRAVDHSQATRIWAEREAALNSDSLRTRR